MMTRQTEAQLAFETFVEKNLQAAVNYAGGNPSIDRIWLYTILDEGSIDVGVYYRYRGRCCGFGELPLLDPDGYYDSRRLREEQDISSWIDLLNTMKNYRRCRSGLSWPMTLSRAASNPPGIMRERKMIPTTRAGGRETDGSCP